MTTQSRLNKATVQLIKIATRVDFVRYQYESGKQKVIALIYISEDVYVTAIAGDGWWDAHDIEKSKRSIRRHNKNCLILDRRDQLIKYSTI